MITLFVEEINNLTPKFYNNCILNLQMHQLKCTCGRSACLKIHGYYKRFVKTNNDKLCFNICRVKCDFCNTTHALLLSSMVPYSQIPLMDFVSAVESYESMQTSSALTNLETSMDESNLRYIIRQYLKYWKQKILSAKIKFHPVDILITSCFKSYNRQFMQIKTTSNIIFFNTT